MVPLRDPSSQGPQARVLSRTGAISTALPGPLEAHPLVSLHLFFFFLALSFLFPSRILTQCRLYLQDELFSHYSLENN